MCAWRCNLRGSASTSKMLSLILAPPAFVPQHARWRAPKTSAVLRSPAVSLSDRPTAYEPTSWSASRLDRIPCLQQRSPTATPACPSGGLPLANGHPWVYSYPGGESTCLQTLLWPTRSCQHLCPPRSPSEGTAGSVPEATRDAEGDVDGLRFRDEAEVAAFYQFYQQEVLV